MLKHVFPILKFFVNLGQSFYHFLSALACNISADRQDHFFMRLDAKHFPKLDCLWIRKRHRKYFLGIKAYRQGAEIIHSAAVPLISLGYPVAGCKYQRQIADRVLIISDPAVSHKPGHRNHVIVKRTVNYIRRICPGAYTDRHIRLIGRHQPLFLKTGRVVARHNVYSQLFQAAPQKMTLNA